jgi:hypothetical protein
MRRPASHRDAGEALANGQEEDALVAFMQTLTDGYAPAQK